MTTSLPSALAVADWRREVHALYAGVRAAASPAEGHRLWIDGRTRLFENHPASPKVGGQRLRHTAYDPDFRFEVGIEPAEEETWTYQSSSDGAVPFRRVGRLTLGALGTIDLWWLESYGGGLFLPLRDGSSGDTSYGAGRYLLDTVKGSDLGGHGEHCVVDLNFAYNPSCAYDPAWSCPLAPAGNRVAAAVPVGELTPA